MGVEAGSSLHEHPSQDGLEAVEERADKITDEGGSGQAQGSKIPGFWWNWPTFPPEYCQCSYQQKRTLLEM